MDDGVYTVASSDSIYWNINVLAQRVNNESFIESLFGPFVARARVKMLPFEKRAEDQTPKIDLVVDFAGLVIQCKDFYFLFSVKGKISNFNCKRNVN